MPSGSGPVCLAHPGGPGFDGGYLASTELERAFTVVYLDPIGTGASEKLQPTSEFRAVATRRSSTVCVRRSATSGRVCSAIRTAVTSRSSTRLRIPNASTA